MDWFTVDKAGLAKLIDKRGKAFAIFELLQNSWDTNAKSVRLDIKAVAGRPYAEVRVTDDDPDGFRNLSHAFTLFAESEKKSDPSKRGRFNLGEKLVLALCDHAEIISTKGSVQFTAEGRRESRHRLDKGSTFIGTMRMTRVELDEVREALLTLIPPSTCDTYVNNAWLPPRKVLGSFEVTLPTEVADEEGYLRKTQRKCVVTVHRAGDDETPQLYEMGIPIVALHGGERWHVNVHQKVPLNLDRDNVTPAYLQTLRVALADGMREHLADGMREHLTGEDATQVWVNAATEDERIAPETVGKVLDERFGKKRAILDPNDPEANKQLMNEGYTVIPGGTLSKGQWENIRQHTLAQPSGKIRPSGTAHNPEGRAERVIDPKDYTAGQRRIVEFTRDLAWRLIRKDIEVRIVNEAAALPHAAWYGNGALTFNLGRLGKAWFAGYLTADHLELILHELSHDKVKDHLTREFADEVGRLAAKVVGIALCDPSFLVGHGYKAAR